MSTYIYYGDTLYHHGIKGQKWGVRKYQNEDGSLTPAGREHYGYGSAKGTAYRVASKVYGLNEKVYNKLGNKTLASMNRDAKKDMLKKASSADKAAAEKHQAKEEHKARLKEVDPELAKNKETKRVAYDYHNMSNVGFAAKYQTSKKTFAKRYAKTDGNTYGSGLKKAAVATLINTVNPVKTPYFDFKSKSIKYTSGGKQAVRLLAKDIAYSELATRVGFNKAEEKYKIKKSI